MIDVALFRRLRVFGIGLLCFIAGVEILRTGLSFYYRAHGIRGPQLSPLFSGAVIVIGIVFYLLVFEPAYRGVRTLTRRLEEAHRSLSAIVDSGPDILVVFDQLGRVTRMNDTGVLLLGYKDPLSLKVENVTDTAASATFAAAYALALAGNRIEIDTVWRKADGSTIPLLAALSPMEADARIAGVVVSMRDQTAVRKSADALKRGEERFRSIFERHPDAAVAIDAEGRYLRVNAAMEQLSGYSATELIGRDLRLTPPEYVPKMRAALRRGLSGEPVQYELQMTRKDGTRRDINVDVVPMFEHDGVKGVYAFVKDVSEAKRASERERVQRDRFRAVSMLAAGSGRDGDAIDNTLKFACESLRIEAANVSLLHEDALTFVHGAGDAYQRGMVVPLVHSFGRHVLGSREILVVRDADDEPWKSDAARGWQPWRSYIAATLFISGEPGGVLAFCSREPHDVDDGDRDFVQVIASLVGSALEREQRERELAEMAFVDPLTALPNRAYFSEQVEAALAQARRHGGGFAVLYMDLDGFKPVNDRLGHHAGDQVLSVVAARLKMVARDTDVVARIGGDEFVILQTRVEELASITRLASRLVDAVCEPIVAGDELISLGASVGVARFPGDAQTAEELLRCADEAMYRAKRAGRNRLEIYV